MEEHEGVEAKECDGMVVEVEEHEGVDECDGVGVVVYESDDVVVVLLEREV